MKIVNFSKSQLIFRMDNGEFLKVQPQSISSQIIATISMINNVISAGTPDQIGIVLSSSYELSLINTKPVAHAYLHNSEQSALAKIVTGKELDVEERSDLSLATENTKLKTQVEDYIKSLKSSEEKIKELESQIKSIKDTDKSKKEIEILNKKIVEIKGELEVSDANVIKLTSDNELLKSERKQLSDEISVLAHNSKEDKALIENLKSEIESLTADNKTLSDKFDKAKESVSAICNKYSISYSDGEWVMKQPDAPKGK